MRACGPFLLLLLATAAPAAVLAQEAGSSPVAPATEIAPEELDEDADSTLVEEVVVTGARQRGAVLGDIVPEVQLDAREVRALGAGSLTELLEALAPQLQSSRGRGGEQPVVLLNGRRISGFREIRGIPPEAIERVDILPEEAALRYGYRADQRVVNFVLRPRFRAVTAEASLGGPTSGGRTQGSADVNVLRLNADGRWTVDLEHERATGLLESERNIAAGDTTVGDAVDVRPFRSLLPETESSAVSGALNRNFGEVSATVNASLEDAESQSLFGLRNADDGATPLGRETRTRTAGLSAVVNGETADWLWSLTGNYDRVRSSSLTDSRADRTDDAPLSARDRARSVNESARAELVLNGSPLELPAGELSTTLRATAEARRFESRTVRQELETGADLSRDRAAAQISLDAPLTSERAGVLGAFGDLSANLNLEVEELSDFGTLRTLGAGLNWEPVERLNLLASFTDEEGAPTVQQLGDPVLLTPNVPVFDFRTGQTVEVTRLEGGSADLLADSRRVLKLGATFRPLKDTDLSLTANYVVTTIDNPISAFPSLTTEIENAFPERFIRDASGRLVQFDSRPLNFDQSKREEIRWGLNWSKRLEPERGAGAFPGAPGGGRPGGRAGPAGGSDTDRNAGRQGGPGFGGGRFGGRPGAGRLQFAIYHTWRLEDSVRIRNGVPELDFLNGSGAGSTGGRPEHEIEAQAGIFKNGFGARAEVDWQSGTFVTDDGSVVSERLDFSDLTTVDLRLFVDFAQRRELVRRHPWLRGARVSLTVDNLFDDRVEVEDQAGLTPLSYQSDLLDPVGRSVRISFRKLFAPRPPGRAGREGPARP